MNRQRPDQGRVLRVKTGYNPNSSSVGSQIPTFLALAGGAAAFTVIVLHTLGAVAGLIRNRSSVKADNEEPPRCE